jgi:hypothetical protein
VYKSFHAKSWVGALLNLTLPDFNESWWACRLHRKQCSCNSSASHVLLSLWSRGAKNIKLHFLAFHLHEDSYRKITSQNSHGISCNTIMNTNKLQNRLFWYIIYLILSTASPTIQKFPTPTDKMVILSTIQTCMHNDCSFSCALGFRSLTEFLQMLQFKFIPWLFL